MKALKRTITAIIAGAMLCVPALPASAAEYTAAPEAQVILAEENGTEGEQQTWEQVWEQFSAQMAADGMESTCEYDAAGRPLTITATSPDGNKMTTMTYTYSESGAMLGATGSGYDRQAQVETSMVVECDDIGRTAKTDISTITEGEYVRMVTVYQYGEDGKLVRTDATIYNADGGVEGYYATEYDGAGNAIRATTTIPNSAEKVVVEYTYYETGAVQQMSQSGYDANGQLTDRFVFEFDTEGKAVSASQYGPNGELIQQVYA